MTGEVSEFPSVDNRAHHGRARNSRFYPHHSHPRSRQGPASTSTFLNGRADRSHRANIYSTPEGAEFSPRDAQYNGEQGRYVRGYVPSRVFYRGGRRGPIRNQRRIGRGSYSHGSNPENGNRVQVRHDPDAGIRPLLPAQDVRVLDTAADMGTAQIYHHSNARGFRRGGGQYWRSNEATGGRRRAVNSGHRRSHRRPPVGDRVDGCGSSHRSVDQISVSSDDSSRSNTAPHLSDIATDNADLAAASDNGGRSNVISNGRDSSTSSGRGSSKATGRGSLNATGRGSLNAAGHSSSKSSGRGNVASLSLRERMCEQLGRGSYECAVCVERISQKAAVWSCGSCYHVFHISCIRRWVRSSRAEDGYWRCPGCQNRNSAMPDVYRCFCEKRANPEWNRRDLAHSCGEVCGKSRADSQCVHKCTLLCHPGPCPPCLVSVKRQCPCGKLTKQLLCDQSSSLICESVCDRMLTCGRHKCQQSCHRGQCPPCDRVLKLVCFCGALSRELLCATASNQLLSDSGDDQQQLGSCGAVCGKQLSCGLHTCQQLCHAPPCAQCPLSPQLVKTCPCGAVSLQKLTGILPRQLTISSPQQLTGISSEQLTGSYPQQLTGIPQSQISSTALVSPAYSAVDGPSGISDLPESVSGGEVESDAVDPSTSIGNTQLNDDDGPKLATDPIQDGRGCLQIESTVRLDDVMNENECAIGQSEYTHDENQSDDDVVEGHHDEDQSERDIVERHDDEDQSDRDIVERDPDENQSDRDIVGAFEQININDTDKTSSTVDGSIVSVNTVIDVESALDSASTLASDGRRKDFQSNILSDLEPQSNAVSVPDLQSNTVSTPEPQSSTVSNPEPRSLLVVTVYGGRRQCSDPVPTCQSVCGRVGAHNSTGCRHPCDARCHEGACPTCHRQTLTRCRCGLTEKWLPCAQLSSAGDDVLCQRRCNKKRMCGRHRCGGVCCILIEHPCTLLCNRRLTCGLHTCDLPCHSGQCQPCWRASFEELYCECGTSVIMPPVPCGTVPPDCNQPCTRQHACNHTVRHNCHSAVDCPPCTELVRRICHGEHETRANVPCHQTTVTCGKPCGKPLPCNQHTCQLICHAGSCTEYRPPASISRLDRCVNTAVVAAGAGRWRCKQPCVRPRPVCGHPCGAPCHDGACPLAEYTCRAKVDAVCACGNRRSAVICGENGAFCGVSMARLAHKISAIQSGGADVVDLTDFGVRRGAPTGPTRSDSQNNNKQKIPTLPCNAECARLARNKQVAEALGIDEEEQKQFRAGTLYPQQLVDMAKRLRPLAEDVHKQLTELVLLAQQSKQKSRCLSFPAMSRDKRQFIHEYSEFFGCESCSHDSEPRRNVEVIAWRGRCKLPPASILVVSQPATARPMAPPSLVAALKTDLPPRSLSMESRQGRVPDVCESATQPKQTDAVIDYFDFKD